MNIPFNHQITVFGQFNPSKSLFLIGQSQSIPMCFFGPPIPPAFFVGSHLLMHICTLLLLGFCSLDSGLATVDVLEQQVESQRCKISQNKVSSGC